MIESITEFFNNLDPVRATFTIFGTIIAIIFGIYIPARILEDYTNQPAMRWIWYFTGFITLVMVYISMYTYGYFWTSYQETKDQDPKKLEQPSAFTRPIGPQ